MVFMLQECCFYISFLNRILFLKIIKNYFLKNLEYIQTNFDFIQNKKLFIYIKR